MTLPLTVDALVVPGDGGRTILTVPQLSVPVGTSLGIRGPSGAGKSTLLHALAGLSRGARGRALWGDTDILALTPAARRAFRRERLGLVFQDPLLFDELSPVANAAVAAGWEPRGRARELERRGAETLLALGVPSGRRAAATYSGGERQRVAVARALAGEPAVLLADEPTASLDRETAAALVNDLLALVAARGTTLIAVSHDEALLARMDRVIAIVDGTLAEARAAAAA